MSGATPPSKKEQLLRLLKHGSVFVHLDPRREDVVVPSWLATKPQLVLQLGLKFAIPIPDLEVDDDGVRCTLSFNRTPFHCTLPWSAVYALVAEDGQVTVWPTELPQELVPEQAAVRKTPPTPRAQRPRSVPPPKPRISVVPPSGERDVERPSAMPPAAIEPAQHEPPAASPQESRAIRGNDSVTMLPPRPEDEDRKTSRRSLPPYLRVVK